MGKIKTFFMTSVIGGLTVILPTIILLAVFSWFFNFLTNLIQPLTKILIARMNFGELIANVIVLLIIVHICFFVGIFVRTRFGLWIFSGMENSILKSLPGYNLVKDTVLQLVGGKKSPFSTVALAQIFLNETLVTAFVTDEHENGFVSVFVPTGPNPTSGFIYHLPSKYVHPVAVSVEDTMRSVLSCGAGSSKLINAYQQKLKER